MNNWRVTRIHRILLYTDAVALSYFLFRRRRSSGVHDPCSLRVYAFRRDNTTYGIVEIVWHKSSLADIVPTHLPFVWDLLEPRRRHTRTNDGRKLFSRHELWQRGHMDFRPEQRKSENVMNANAEKTRSDRP